MNWGYKILFVYLAFITGILFMVFRSTGEKTDLVAPDYYEQELKYQDKIDQAGRTASLSSPLQYNIANGRLSISFPGDFKGKTLEGNIILYCPSDKRKDLRQPFMVMDETVSLGLPGHYAGMFELQVSWKSDGNTYYYEKKIFI